MAILDILTFNPLSNVFILKVGKGVYEYGCHNNTTGVNMIVTQALQVLI